ncbi:lipopolysaccharide biosynthesis protein [Planococcus sp. 1R117A]|uniref:lipopolysaccharide biosynthesis protein n=1 Tax=Planococcus sp. 1R117A TaxID=3447020 RepID=UPI003EDC263F
MKTQSTLKKKAVRGVLWSFGDKLANQGSQFIIQVLLARLLLPEHFGLIGLVLVFNAISSSIVDSGFSQALIRERKVTQKDYSTIFFFNMAVSIFIYLILFMIAPLMSEFFEEPKLSLILRVLAIGIVINSFGIIPRVMFAREVDYKTLAKVNFATSIVSGMVAIYLALKGFGVWSLIARVLIMNVLQSFFSLLATRWVPTLIFSLSSFGRLFSFGWKLLISVLINTIYQNIYTLIIGKQFSTVQLGYYSNAYRFSNMVSQTLTSTIQRVAYPILSSIQDEEERLKQTYRKTIKITAFVLFPLMIGLAAVGEPLIALVFGEQWMPMVIYFQLLCLAGMLYPIQSINLNVLQVKGRSDLFLILEIIKIAVASVLIILAIWLETGILGLVGLAILNSYIALFINTYFSASEISYPIMEQIKDLTPIYIVSMIMGAVVFIIGKLLPYGSLLELIIQVFSGFVFYILGCTFKKVTELKTVYELLVPIVKKIKLLKAG